MRTALNNLYRLSNQNEDRTPNTGDWAVFSTSKTPQDVQSFYTDERMTSFGKWDASKKSTCLNGSEHHFSGVACVFNKTVKQTSYRVADRLGAGRAKETDKHFLCTSRD
jgi:hypothetical protein